MPTTKRVLCPARLRQVPAQFSWVDHRLVRQGHLRRCDAHAAALYLFLVTVADSQGLSYYSDRSIAWQLSMPLARVIQARADLLACGLIAHEPPLYQVLALHDAALVSPAPIVTGLADPHSTDPLPEHAHSVPDITEQRRRLDQLRGSLRASRP